MQLRPHLYRLQQVCSSVGVVIARPATDSIVSSCKPEADNSVPLMAGGAAMSMASSLLSLSMELNIQAAICPSVSDQPGTHDGAGRSFDEPRDLSGLGTSKLCQSEVLSLASIRVVSIESLGVLEDV